MLSKIERYSTSAVSYSAQTNSFITTPYVSAANNTYFKSIRIGEGIVVDASLGQGYAHTFLNSIRIYSMSGKLIADRCFDCNFYSLEKLIRQSKDMLLDMLEKALEAEGQRLIRSEAEPKILGMLNRCFRTSQLEMAGNIARYLIA